MPENNMADGAEGEALDRLGADDGAESDEGRDDTYFLPKAVLKGQPFKSGDILKFKVVGEDQDGQVEVECLDGNDAKGEPKMSWQDDMRASVPPEAASQPREQSY